MNKQDVINEMARKTGLTRKNCEQALNALTSTVQTTIMKREKVTLLGFGSWDIRQRAARVGFNPKTRKEMKISASKVPVFKAGKGLKDVVL